MRERVSPAKKMAANRHPKGENVEKQVQNIAMHPKVLLHWRVNQVAKIGLAVAKERRQGMLKPRSG